jgi:hypothetical protein
MRFKMRYEGMKIQLPPFVAPATSGESMRLLLAGVAVWIASLSMQISQVAFSQDQQEPVRLMSGGPGT